MQSKTLEKIVVATGVGRLRDMAQFEDAVLPAMSQELALITGQKPEPRLARKSIAGFKLREGSIVGLRVTLRGQRMRDFLERLTKIALPRVRDFRGINPRQIDGEGNLTIGFRDHTVFPEITPEDSKFNFGFQITLVSGIRDRGEAAEFFKSLGVPLREEEVKTKNG